MSATATALSLDKAQPRIVTVRLADPALFVAYLSVVFGVLLVCFPVSFPRIIVQNWWSGRLTLAMILSTVLLDMGLYLRVAHRRSARPGRLASAFLGCLPVIVVVGLSFLLKAAIARALLADLPNLQARIAEEILAHTYFTLVSAAFFPFLSIRLLQQLKTRNS